LTVRVELPDGLALRVAPDATVGITRGNADLVVVDEVDVVVRVAAIGIEVDAAVAADGIRMGAEEPVDDVDLMRRELGREPARHLAVEPPVDDLLELGIRRRPAHLVVLVPLRAEAGEIADAVAVAGD